MRLLTLFLLLNCPLAVRADVIASYRILEPDQLVARSPERRVLATNNAMLQETWGATLGKSDPAYRKTLQRRENNGNRVITLDAALKVYKVEPMVPAAPPGFSFPEIRVSKIGREKMLGFNTNRFTIDTLYGSQAPGTEKMLARQEIWVLPTAELAGLPTTTRNFGFLPREKITGDANFWDEIQSGIWVKKTVFELASPDTKSFKPIYSEEISSLTIGTLSPAMLELPGDCREVSGADFDRLRAQNKREIEARPTQSAPIVIAPRTEN
jgi:hypothetical protein